MNQPFYKSLHGRFLVVMLGLTALPALLIGITAFPNARATIENNIEAKLAAIADLKKQEIVTWLNTTSADARSLADNFLNEEHFTEILDPTTDPDRKEAFSNFLMDNFTSIQQARSGYSEIMIVDTAGKVILSTDPSKVGFDRSSYPTISGTLNSDSGTFIHDIHMEPESQEIEMAFGHVLHAIDLNTFEKLPDINGILVIRVRMEDTIYPFVQVLPGMGETGETLLVRAQGDETVFLNPLRFDDRPALDLQIPIDSTRAEPAHLSSRGAEGVIQTLDYRGVPVLAAYRHIPGVDWGVVAKEDLDEAYAPVAELTRQVLLIGTLVLLTAIGVSVLLARALIKPLAHLVSAAQSVAAGNLETQLKIHSHDEIGALADAFNQMIAALLQRQHQLQLADQAALSIVDIHSVDEVLQQIVDQARELLDARYAALDVRDTSGKITSFFTSGLHQDEVEAIGQPPERHGILGDIWKQVGPNHLEELGSEPGLTGFPPHHPIMKSLIGTPIKGRNRILGTLYLTDKIAGKRFTKVDEDMLVRLAGLAGVAIGNADLFVETRQQATDLRAHSEEMEALFNLSKRLLGTLDIDDTLNNALMQIIAVTNSDIGSIFLVDHSRNELVHRAAFGLPDPSLGQRFPIDVQTSSGYAVIRNETVSTSDVRTENRFRVPLPIEALGVRGVLTVPIVIGGRAIGAIPLGSYTVREFNEKEIRIAQAIANQAAVALERARLFSDLNDSYDRTLDALVAALDARDKETEGHTHRVVTYTMALGRQMNLSEDALVTLRRGALLHDIGKIGVPDSILRKPGPLTEEEWGIMRKHPELGEKILRGIPFLEDAAQIVCAHHEHWSGAGYPMGMRGEDIPLGARIFTVADALDAITSDRPYRSEQSFAFARQEIQAQGGAQFDPQVVDAFMQISEKDWGRLRRETLAAQIETLQLPLQLDPLTVFTPELETLNQMLSVVSSSLELESVLQETSRAAVEILGNAGSGLFLFQSQTDSLTLAADYNLPESIKSRFSHFPVVGFHNEMVVREGRLKIIRNLKDVPEFVELDIPSKWPGLGEYVCVPLIHNGDVKGVMGVFSPALKIFDEHDLQLYTAIGEHVGLAIEHARLHESVQQLSVIDGLTGAYNRRHLDQFLVSEILRCSRYQHGFSVLMIDIDVFKSYNDKYGHLAGDEALKELVRILISNLREVDLIARYGGDEFIAVLPETNLAGARTSAEKIRKIVAHHPFPKSKITISIGIAHCGYPETDMANPESILEIADQGLYMAKSLGGNTVQVRKSHQ